MLSAAQQSVAVLAYVKNRLITDKGDASLLQDPFFLANLDYNFTGLFEIYAGMLDIRLCARVLFVSKPPDIICVHHSSLRPPK